MHNFSLILRQMTLKFVPLLRFVTFAVGIASFILNQAQRVAHHEISEPTAG